MKLKDFRKLLLGCDPEAEVIIRPESVLSPTSEPLSVCETNVTGESGKTVKRIVIWVSPPSQQRRHTT